MGQKNKIKINYNALKQKEQQKITKINKKTIRHEKEEEEEVITCKVPRFVFVNIDLRNSIETERFIGNLPFQVIDNEFFICWVESKPRS